MGQRLGPIDPDDPPERRCSECGEITRVHDSHDLCECERAAAETVWRLADTVSATDPCLCPECQNIVEPDAPPLPADHAPEPDPYGNTRRRITCPACGHRGTYLSPGRRSRASAAREGFTELGAVDGVHLPAHFDTERLQQVHERD